MSKTKLNVSAIDLDEVLFGDGHTIFEPNMYTKAGIPEDWLKPLIRRHESGDGHTSTIYVDGERRESLSGVYHLSFLYRFAREIEADTDLAERKCGRGSQARELVKAIREALDK